MVKWGVLRDVEPQTINDKLMTCRIWSEHLGACNAQICGIFSFLLGYLWEGVKCTYDSEVSHLQLTCKT